MQDDVNYLQTGRLELYESSLVCFTFFLLCFYFSTNCRYSRFSWDPIYV